MKQAQLWIGAGLLAIGAAAWCGPARGADETPKPLPPLQEAPAATQPATQPSSEQVIQELMSHRQPNPDIEPVRRPPIDAVTTINPAIVGIAPGTPGGAPGAVGGEGVKLHREGDFVVSRRARIIHPAGTMGLTLLAFEGDGASSPEAPMILAPCQMRQDMEDIVAERGDKVAFIVSGEVLLYRGANYLQVTMWKMDIDRGNLKH